MSLKEESDNEAALSQIPELSTSERKYRENQTTTALMTNLNKNTDRGTKHARRGQIDSKHAK